MAWYHRLWPFYDEAKAEERRQIEREFQAQLDAALKRRGDLEDAATELRLDRERHQRQPSRPKFSSRPSIIDLDPEQDQE